MSTQSMCRPSRRRKSSRAKVHVVDDRSDVCAAILDMLNPAWRVFEHESAEVFLETADLFELGCVIVDHGLPGQSGLELIRLMKQRSSTLATLLMSGAADIPLVVSAFESGVVGFLEKPFDSASLEAKVEKAVTESEKACTSRVEHNVRRRRTELLTGREQEVLSLLVAGFHSKLIAKKLGMAYNTARVHRANVLKKMKARTVVELAQMMTP